MTMPNHRVDRTAAEPASFSACREHSRLYSGGVTALPPAVGHSYRSALYRA